MKKIFFLSLLAAVVVTCGGQSPDLGTTPIIEPPDRAKELAEDGWIYYKEAKYDSAIIKFNDSTKANESYLDAYTGLGWSHFRDHNLFLSISNFGKVIDADSTIVEVNIGYAFAAFERNEYSISVETIMNVIAQDSMSFDLEGFDDYEFSRDSEIKARAIRKVLALSYYYSGDFTSSYNQLLTYLDPLTTVDPNAESFYYDLFRALVDQ